MRANARHAGAALSTSPAPSIASCSNALRPFSATSAPCERAGSDFATLATKLHQRLTSKHAKQSDEGRALRALREIRVLAAPGWNATHITLTLLFIRNDDTPAAPPDWSAQLARWLNLTPPSGRYTAVHACVQTLDDLSARDYVESDRLDLDRLSARASG